MYFGWNITGISQVWKLDGPRSFPRQLTAGEDSTGVVAVTPDGAWVVVQRDRKGEENPGIYLQPAAGGPLVVVQHIPKVQTLFERVSPDSKYVYFTSNDSKPDSYVIYRWDIEKGEREVVFDQDGLWHVDDMRADGRLLLRKETGSLSAEYSEWDPAQKQLTPLFGQGEKDEYEARYGAKKGELIVLTNKAGEYREPLFVDGAGGAHGARRGRAGGRGAFDDRREAHAHRLHAERGRLPPSARDGRAHATSRSNLPKLPEADQVVFGETTPDGRFTTLGVDDGRHPRRATSSTGRPESSMHGTCRARPRSTRRSSRARRSSRTRRRTGRASRCSSGVPRGARADPCAVIVAFHGGPEAQALPGFNVSAQMFVDAGFVFVEPNVRGSEGYGKTWSHADDGPKRLSIITDIDDAAKWAKTTFASNGKEPKVGVYGGSYGGYSVLMAMTMFAGDYDAGVDIVGISDLRTFLRNTAPYRRILRISRVRRSRQGRRGAREALAHDVRRPREGAAAHHPGSERSARAGGRIDRRSTTRSSRRASRANSPSSPTRATARRSGESRVHAGPVDRVLAKNIWP